MSHSTCTHRGRVDSQLLVVGSQTASLTPGPSFDHNLCCKCPNGSCEAILDIYLQEISMGTQNTSMRGVLTPAIKLWVFGSLEGLQVPTFGSVSFILTFASKWGWNTRTKVKGHGIRKREGRPHKWLFQSNIWTWTPHPILSFKTWFPWLGSIAKCLFPKWWGWWLLSQTSHIQTTHY